MTKEKATGWKVPLMFCGSVTLVVFLASLFIPHTPQAPHLPEELESRARAIRIEMDDPEGKTLMEAITSAASGFADHGEKDKKLAHIVKQTLQKERYDAACTALALIRNDDARATAVDWIADMGMRSCATLPWTVFAYRASGSADQKRKLYQKISEKWRLCGNQ